MDNLQKERQQRGEDFQDEIRRSWTYVPNTWRLRIADKCRAGSRPADELTLTATMNILGEHKRTAGDRFEISFLRTNQRKALVDFDNCLPQNYGLVFVSFLNDERDSAYVFKLIEFYKYIQCKKVKYITERELRQGKIKNVCLSRISYLEGPGYELKEAADWYRYL